MDNCILCPLVLTWTQFRHRGDQAFLGEHVFHDLHLVLGYIRDVLRLLNYTKEGSRLLITGDVGFSWDWILWWFFSILKIYKLRISNFYKIRIFSKI